MFENILKAGAEELNIQFDQAALEDFRQCYEFLEEKNKVMNLTALRGEEDIAKLHFLDSLSLLKITDFKGKAVIDIGSGAGFPGMPLKIAEPTIKLTLLDSNNKKIGFLKELCEKTGRADVQSVHFRAEEAGNNAFYREKFDYCLSRAVARLNLLCELCMPFASPGGAFIAMKSVDSEEEINEAKSAIKLLGGKIEAVKDYLVPGTEILHRAVIIRKTGNTPKEFPRRFAKIQKEPL